jgi:hypothetical protein
MEWLGLFLDDHPGAATWFLAQARAESGTRWELELRNWFSGRYLEVFEARSTKEESQPPVRAKIGATWVP